MMKTTISQPPIWLNVKKEYVIDNFDNLFQYLRSYTYVDSAEVQRHQRGRSIPYWYG